MASAVQSLRLCLRAYRHAPAPQRLAPRIFVATRQISMTPTRWRRNNEEEEDLDEEELQEGQWPDLEDEDGNIIPGKKPSRQEIKQWDEAATQMERDLQELDQAVALANKPPPPKAMKKSFWGEDEEDPDLMVENTDDDDFSEDDIMSMAHGKLEEHREFREYARIAAWQMPLLSKLARPFQAPTSEECLRFRYTTYMGETHPAQNKVVVEFSPRDLPLNEAQRLKLKKLLGARWNPEKDIVKMSCEQFTHQAQNKRYLGDLVAKLIEQAKDSTDMFEDVPLDTRHYKKKSKPKFPFEWRITEERQKEIEDTRQKSLLLDQAKEEAGTLVDGAERVKKYFQEAPVMRIPELVRQRLPAQRQPPPRVRR